jgi:hypothetical protein
MTRPTFVIRLQALRGGSIHGLRAILKRLLRTHGFRCISAREEQPPPPIREADRD